MSSTEPRAGSGREQKAVRHRWRLTVDVESDRKWFGLDEPCGPMIDNASDAFEEWVGGNPHVIGVEFGRVQSASAPSADPEPSSARSVGPKGPAADA